jgi:hypothetical protein
MKAIVQRDGNSAMRDEPRWPCGIPALAAETNELACQHKLP